MIKPCFVKLDKICDTRISELLAKRMYSNNVQSNSKCLEIASLQSSSMIHNSPENLVPDRDNGSSANVIVDVDLEFMPTEQNLDLLMVREMDSSHPQTEKIFNERVKHTSSNSVNNWNLNPVVCLKRLSPQFISKAINGLYFFFLFNSFLLVYDV